MEAFICLAKGDGFDKCKNQCDYCTQKSEMIPLSYKHIPKRSTDRYLSIRMPKTTYAKLEHLGLKDNRNLSNLVVTMILNELGDLSYDFEIKKVFEKYIVNS